MRYQHSQLLAKLFLQKYGLTLLRYVAYTAPMMIETHKEGSMTPKTITIDNTESLTMDADGRWRLIDTACKLNEPISEAEAIDVLTRRARKNHALRPLLAEHFPMRNFHAAPATDRTPNHKPDAY